MKGAATVTTAHQWDTAQKRMGAWSELRASAHLLARGFDVYRSVSAAAAFDLVAHKDGKLVRVEVKTISRSKSETYCPPFGWPVNDEWDLLLIVGPNEVFEFESNTTRDEARDFIRQHYGLALVAGPTQHDVALTVLRDALDQTWTARSLALCSDGRLTVRQSSASLNELARTGVVVRTKVGVYRFATKGHKVESAPTIGGTG